MKPLLAVITAIGIVSPACGIAAQLLVLNKADATLAFMDPLTGSTLATIPTGDGPHEIEL
jgi:hypothetical protein